MCGKNYRRKVITSGVVWICETFDRIGKAACASKQVPEETLKGAAAKAMGMEEFVEAVFRERMESILVCNGNKLVFVSVTAQKPRCIGRTVPAARVGRRR